jgi:hypothetical protein
VSTTVKATHTSTSAISSSNAFRKASSIPDTEAALTTTAAKVLGEVLSVETSTGNVTLNYNASDQHTKSVRREIRRLLSDKD